MFIICVDNKLPDFGEKYFFEVDKNQAVLVPKGYANALITLEPNTIIQYLVDNTYSPENERSLYYGSVPEFKSMVDGFTNTPVISEKDLNGILWEDWSNQ